jgi:hypothetical protein
MISKDNVKGNTAKMVDHSFKGSSLYKIIKKSRCNSSFFGCRYRQGCSLRLSRAKISQTSSQPMAGHHGVQLSSQNK